VQASCGHDGSGVAEVLLDLCRGLDRGAAEDRGLTLFAPAVASAPVLVRRLDAILPVGEVPGEDAFDDRPLADDLIVRALCLV
jgi:hypothetical protein